MGTMIVTGGAGFIGTHLVSRLIDDKHRVVVFDNLATALTDNIHSRAEFIHGDVASVRDLVKLPDHDVDAVFHLAAQSSGEISFDDPEIDFRTNVTGSFRLLNWCKSHRVRRFIFTSSMAAYGRNSDRPITEDTPCRPVTPYGTSKLAAENFINFHATQEMQCTILRLFNVYGSRQNLDNLKQGMASIYLSFLLKQEPILVKGSLERFRDQTHVSDVVDAMIRCLDNPKAAGATYNIATGTRTTVKTLIDTLIRIGGRDTATYPVREVEGTPGDLFGCYADVSKARAQLNWTSRCDLEEGLSEMYRYFSAGRKGSGHE